MEIGIEELLELESATLLLRREEFIKSRLPALSEKLLQEILDYKAGSSDPIGTTLAALFNRGALLQFLTGAFDRAETLCDAEIDCFGAAAEREGTRGWLAQVIQPHINLARVATARGNVDDALATYSALAHLVTDSTPLQVGRFVIGADEFQTVVTYDPSIPHVIQNVYIVDSLKTLLWAEKHTSLLRFVDQATQDPWISTDYLRNVLQEARARALIGTQTYPEALRVVDALASDLNREGRPQLALYALMAEVYRRCGRDDQAQRLLSFVERHLPQLATAPDGGRLARNVRYLLALGHAAGGRADAAYRAAEQALGDMMVVGDEIGALKSLMLLMSVARMDGRPEEEWRQYREQLHDLARGSGYSFERGVALLHMSRADGDRRTACLAESLAIFSSLPLALAARWRQRIRTEIPGDAHLPIPALRPDRLGFDASVTAVYTSLLRLGETHGRGMPDEHRQMTSMAASSRAGVEVQAPPPAQRTHDLGLS